jgi:hypothetical protein
MHSVLHFVQMSGQWPYFEFRVRASREVWVYLYGINCLISLLLYRGCLSAPIDFLVNVTMRKVRLYAQNEPPSSQGLEVFGWSILDKLYILPRGQEVFVHSNSTLSETLYSRTSLLFLFEIAPQRNIYP